LSWSGPIINCEAHPLSEAFLTFCAGEFVSYSAKDRKETRCKAAMMQHACRYFTDALDSR
jgi:hypothetical protein